MGIAQRDYMRGDHPRSFASARDAVPIIIGINILVFVLWQLKPEFFIHYFPLNLARLRQGQIWTVLTSVFSHYNFMLIFFNMFVLYSFGRVLENVWGTRRFTIFYLLSGITASFVHVMLAMFGWRDSLALLDVDRQRRHGSVDGELQVLVLAGAGFEIDSIHRRPGVRVSVSWRSVHSHYTTCLLSRSRFQRPISTPRKITGIAIST